MGTVTLDQFTPLLEGKPLSGPGSTALWELTLQGFYPSLLGAGPVFVTPALKRWKKVEKK